MKLPKLPKLSLPPAVWIVLIVALLTVSVGTGIYFYRRAMTAEAIIKDPQKLGKEDAKRLVESLRKLMELPADEEPTIATVADASKLKDQPFFANSQNGDRVIVYTKARKAILYRPSTNKIIDVAPVSLGENQGQSSAEETPAPPAPPALPMMEGTVVVLNGTAVAGITKKVEDGLKAEMPGLTFGDRDNAVRKNYEKTIVIDAKGGKQELARAIARSLGAGLSGLPEGEATPSADIVIIVGEDKK